MRIHPLLLAVLCLGCAALGYGSRRIVGVARGDEALVATVNGEKISHHELERAIAPYRMNAVRDLVFQHLMQQKANEANIQISPEDVTQSFETKMTPEEKLVAEDRARTDALRRKLILRKVTEEQKKAIFDLFLPELRRYDLTVVAFAVPEDEQNFRKELERGVPFQDLATRYTAGIENRPDKNHLVRATSAEIAQQYGPYLAAQLVDHVAGEMTDPVASPYGIPGSKVPPKLLARIEKVYDTYPELKKDVEQVVVEGQSLFFDFEMARSADVYSPYMLAGIPHQRTTSPKGDVNLPRVKATGSATPAPTLPRMNLTPTATPTGLPGLNASPTATPTGLAAPKSTPSPTVTP